MAKLPKFFKFVSKPAEHKLKIPTEFTRRHGHKLPNIIFLKVPTGSSSWKIELKRTENEIWLGKGWQEFKRHYLIEFGYFLVFEYQGNAQCNVIICDITASEIEYSLDDANQGSEMKETGSGSHDSDFIFMEEISTPKAANTEKCNTDSGIQSLKITAKGVDKTTCLAYQRAKKFKSDNPFYIAIMHPSYVSGNEKLSIPLCIADANLPHRHNNLELRVGNGKTWSVSCTIYTKNAKFNCAGWKKFVDENKLEVGDVCIFEVVKRKELVWNVIIFRNLV